MAANPTVKVCVHPQDSDGLVGYDNLNHLQIRVVQG